MCVVCNTPLKGNENFVCDNCLKTILASGSKFDKKHLLQNMRATISHLKSLNSLFIYNKNEAYKSVITDIKYSNKPKLGMMLGELAGNELKKWFEKENFDVIVPVPLHKKRKNYRGYNQSELIAGGLKKVTGIPIDTKVLFRVVDNKTQTRKSFIDRKKNVSGIFEARNISRLSNKHILLVDDVLTTGSTIGECVNTLYKADSTIKVSAFTLAIAHNDY